MIMYSDGKFDIRNKGMSEQLLMRLTKPNRSGEMYSPMRRNTRKQQYANAFDNFFFGTVGSLCFVVLVSTFP